jgi:hypothetical protein
MNATKPLGLSVVALLALVVALTIGASSASAALAPPTTVDLIAGQHNVVGTITVTPLSSTSLQVVYQLTSGCLTETHVAAASTAAGIPHTKQGNPIPGQFAQGETFSSCQTSAGPYVFTGLTPGGNAVVAAHAVVTTGGTTTTAVASGTGTLVTEINGAPVNQPAVAANEPFNFPDCLSYTPDDASPSLWDANAHLLGGATPDWGSADWIWATRNPQHPILGDIVTFRQTFTVPAGSQLGGMLTITADNAFGATLNGTVLGDSISVGPGFPGTLVGNLGGGAQLGNWGIASQGWQLVRQLPLTGLVAGANTLEITAANESMNLGDSFLDWDNAGQHYLPSASPDPVPGTGLPTDGSQCFNPGFNPAGLIFNLTAQTQTAGGSDTAWGNGQQFAGANWAMYIPVTL